MLFEENFDFIRHFERSRHCVAIYLDSINVLFKTHPFLSLFASCIELYSKDVVYKK